MSDLEAKVIEHPLHEEVANLLRVIEPVLEEESDPDRVSRLAHVSGVLTRVRSVLSRVDPSVAPLGPLDQGAKRVHQADSELKAYQSDGNVGRLENLVAHSGNLLLDVLRLPRIETPEDVGDLSENIVSFRRTLGQHLRYAEEHAEKVRESVDAVAQRAGEVRKDLAEQKKRVDTAVGELQDQFSAAEDRRRQQFEEAIKSVNSAATQLEARFEQSQTDRKEAFAAFEARLEEAQEDTEARLQEEFASAKERIENDSAALLEALAKDKAEAAKILGAIAQTGITKGFQRSANSERIAMRFWQGITVLALLGFAAVLVFFLPTNGPPTNGAEFSWSLFSQRVLVSLAFAGLAAYGGREAARHGERERKYRQMELEFASVGPFLARLPKEKQDQAIEQIADRTFARATHEEVSEMIPATTNGLLDIIRMTTQELLKRGR
jgi:hypothetical protein